MRVEIIDNEIKTLKDCGQCIHRNTCKFLEEAKNFSKKNVMYQMNKYLESNNLLNIFEIHSRCSHYKCEINKGFLDLTYPKDLLTKVFSVECKKRGIEMASYSLDLKEDKVSASVIIGERFTANNQERKEFILTEFIKDYKVI